MLVFAQAPWLFLLPLPLLITFIRTRHAMAPHPHEAASILHPQAALLAELAGAAQQSGGRNTRLLWLAGCALLIVALARPQWLDFSSPAARQGHDLMVAIDVSGSMRALDLADPQQALSRLAVVKTALADFLDKRSGDRVGVILFGDHAATYIPLTTDLDLLQNLLTDIRPGLLGERTALGDAVALAVTRLQDRPPAARLLLLFSDGANTAGDIPPAAALELARRHGVRIFTIAVGTAGKVLFPRGPVMAPEVTQLPPDEGLLRQLGEESGGAFYHAAASTDMARILADIDTLAPTDIHDPARAGRREWYWLPLMVGLSMLLLAQYRSRRTVLP